MATIISTLKDETKTNTIAPRTALKALFDDQGNYLDNALMASDVNALKNGKIADMAQDIQDNADAINAISTPVLLWTNPDMSTKFSSQTIPINNISEYRIVFMICGAYFANGPFVTSTQAFRDVVGNGGIAINKHGDNWGTRTFEIVQNGVKINDAYLYSGYDTTIENSRCFPTRLYGIK